MVRWCDCGQKVGTDLHQYVWPSVVLRQAYFMIDLGESRRRAWAPVVDSYYYDELRVLVLEL